MREARGSGRLEGTRRGGGGGLSSRGACARPSHCKVFKKRLAAPPSSNHENRPQIHDVL